MRFADPWFLVLFLLFIPILWIYIQREKGKQPSVRFSDISLITSIPPSLLVRLRHIIVALFLSALACMIIALARPQTSRTEHEITTFGVDIMLILDVSTSMKALDFKPSNRLVVAKETIKKFIANRPTDRMGLVIFSGRAYTKCPLTLDHSILYQFIEDIDFGEVEDGTAIGTAIATAANRLKDSQAKSKIIILLTDGANNRGEITPLVASEAAAKLNIKVYTIGVGKTGEIPYPFDYVNPWNGAKETQVQLIQSDLDEQTLIAIAQQTKAQFFRATNPKELEDIYSTIDKMEKSEIKTTSYTTYTEHFVGWLYAAVALVLIQLLLKYTWFRRLP